MSEPETAADLSAQIELQKLSFERQKQTLEEEWKKRTFTWTIASTLLGSIVSVTIALISTGGKGDGGSVKNVNPTAVENCRLSIQRLPTLAMQEKQTVPNLRDAITRHVADCEPVLAKL